MCSVHREEGDIRGDSRSTSGRYRGTACRCTERPSYRVGLYGHQIMPGLSTNKQRHRLRLLKTGIHIAPTHHQAMLSFGNINGLKNKIHTAVIGNLEEILDKHSSKCP